MKMQSLSEYTGVEVIPTTSTDVDSIDIDKVIAALKTEGVGFITVFMTDRVDKLLEQEVINTLLKVKDNKKLLKAKNEGKMLIP